MWNKADAAYLKAHRLANSVEALRKNKERKKKKEPQRILFYTRFE